MNYYEFFCIICGVSFVASYDWLQTDFDNKPSGYITDLVAFLQGIFSSFTNLPVRLSVGFTVSLCDACVFSSFVNICFEFFFI